MPTLVEARRQQRTRRFVYLVVFVLGLALIDLVTSYRFGAIVDELRPPVLPEIRQYSPVPPQSEQNWAVKDVERFHHESQGSRTLNVPLSWFLAMEAPSTGVFSFFLSEQPLFSSDDYLPRFGFIPAEKSAYNPHGLPIGFASTPYQSIIGLDEDQEAIGFTCAACHTGQLVYEGERHIINGGPGMIDLGQLTIAIGASLGQTALSTKIPLFQGRFDRFARRVLGDQYNDENAYKLGQDLDNVVQELAKVPNGIDVTEGFARLDALNRIGNQVFAIDPNRPENYVNINAPVNFPHIWTSSWFTWVQYDGSIMQPLIRNTGEAMGTAANTNYTAPIGHGRFTTAVPLGNLAWMEDLLAGPDQPAEVKSFNGLRSPAWPESFPAINTELAAEGEKLYGEICQRCHLPALTRAVETGQDTENLFWKTMRPFGWYEKGKTEPTYTAESLIQVKIVEQSYMGTDPGQGNVLAQRKVDTARTGNSDALGIDIEVCARSEGHYKAVHIEDNPMLAYPFALGAVVQEGINATLKNDLNSARQRDSWEGDRPNCLQAGAGYKARPLNGVWATAPFLHNGSVPTLAHLLGNPEERPDEFLLGDPTFDPVNVGVTLPPVPDTTSDYTEDGYFILRTSKTGNSNRGHEFSDVKGPGVIHEALEDSEIAAIIEFLKTI